MIGTDIKYCRFCGRRLPASAAFCTACGKRTETEKNPVEEAVAAFKAYRTEASFNELYRLTYLKVYAYVQMLTKNRDITEDVLQNGYLTAYQKIDQLKDDKSFVAWIKNICYHDFLHSINDREVLIGDTGNEDDTDFFDNIEDMTLELPEKASEDAALKALISRTIEGLPVKQRVAVMQFYFRERSVRELAADMGVPENTVKTYLNRARKTMNASMRDHADAHGLKLVPVAAVPFLYKLLGEQAKACELSAGNSIKPIRVDPVAAQAAPVTQTVASSVVTKAGISTGAKVTIAALITTAVAGAGVGGLYIADRIQESRWESKYENVKKADAEEEIDLEDETVQESDELPDETDGETEAMAADDIDKSEGSDETIDEESGDEPDKSHQIELLTNHYHALTQDYGTLKGRDFSVIYREPNEEYEDAPQWAGTENATGLIGSYIIEDTDPVYMITVRLDGDNRQSITEIYMADDDGVKLINKDVPVTASLGIYDDVMHLGYAIRDDGIYLYQSDYYFGDGWEGGYKYTYLGVYRLKDGTVENLTGLSEAEDIASKTGVDKEYEAKGFIPELDRCFNDFDPADYDINNKDDNPFYLPLSEYDESITDIASTYFMRRRDGKDYFNYRDMRDYGYYVFYSEAETEEEDHDEPAYDALGAGMIFPNSSEEPISRSDIEDLSDEELRYAINEIYARHGYIFKDDGLRTYYEQFDWYEKRIKPGDFSVNLFNSIEMENIERMQKEREHR